MYKLGAENQFNQRAELYNHHHHQQSVWWRCVSQEQSPAKAKVMDCCDWHTTTARVCEQLMSFEMIHDVSTFRVAVYVCASSAVVSYPCP